MRQNQRRAQPRQTIQVLLTSKHPTQKCVCRCSLRSEIKRICQKKTINALTTRFLLFYLAQSKRLPLATIPATSSHQTSRCAAPLLRDTNQRLQAPFCGSALRSPYHSWVGRHTNERDVSVVRTPPAHTRLCMFLWEKTHNATTTTYSRLATTNPTATSDDTSDASCRVVASDGALRMKTV